MRHLHISMSHCTKLECDEMIARKCNTSTLVASAVDSDLLNVS